MADVVINILVIDSTKFRVTENRKRSKRTSGGGRVEGTIAEV